MGGAGMRGLGNLVALFGFLLVVGLVAGGQKTLTEEQVASYARRAGFPEPTISKAVTVARCESGLRPAARGDKELVDGKWLWSVGLWQIRTTWKDTRTGGTRDALVLQDPLANARAAYRISLGGRDWSAWTCGP